MGTIAWFETSYRWHISENGQVQRWGRGTFRCVVCGVEVPPGTIEIDTEGDAHPELAVCPYGCKEGDIPAYAIQHADELKD